MLHNKPHNFAKIVSTGAYLPEKIVTNTELEKTLDTSDAWIRQRTGIISRRIAGEDDTTLSMAVKASVLAMQRAELSGKDIDLVITATCSSEQVFPAVACLLQAELNIPSCAAFDVQGACCGFLYALSVANAMLQSGMAKRALVVGTEVMSRVLNWQDRGTAVLFGDGAGVVILEASNEPGILAVKLGSDGTKADLLHLSNNAFLCMQGSQVFRFAVQHLSEVALSILNEQKMKASDINWFIPHQANIRIIEAMAKRLDLDLAKVVTTVGEHANTSAASIPLALDHAVVQGKVARGNNILLESFGGGLTWGAILVRY